MPTTATQIVDNSGAVWTIRSDAQILRNGMATAGVGTKILWSGGIIYVYGTDNKWWQWTGSSWTSAGDVNQSPISADGTSLPPASQIVDSAGAVWTIGANAAILRNGAQTSGFGTTITWAGSTIYVFGTDGKWWQWTGSGWVTGAPPATTPTTPSTSASPDGTTVPASATQIVDNAGAIWTIGAGSAILRNAVQTGGYGSKILWSGGAIYVDGGNSWWQWTGSGWTSTSLAASTPTSTSTAASPDGTTVPTSASQIVDNAGAVWTIGTDGSILRNGARTGGYGTKILWSSGTIYVYGGSSWWQWTGSGWVSVTLTSTTPLPSATATLPAALDAAETSTAPAGYLARIVAPANQMHFTAGLPLRFFADVRDVNEWQCPPGSPPYDCPDNSVTFFDNGTAIGTISDDATSEDLWELRLPNGLPAGDHRITCVYTPTNPPSFTSGTPISCNAPGVLIHVDPAPFHATTLTLSSDIILSGGANLNLSDTTVIGSGFRIISTPGYTGNVSITNTFLSGVGGFAYGADISTAGSVTIDRVIHEASGPIRIASSGTLAVTNNEFRENDRVTYSPTSDPDVAVLLDLTANSAVPALFQGNNIGGGITRLKGTGRWQIGGLSADRGNIIIGPRGVLSIDSPGAVIQGNYMHHEYPTRWSQGFNLITAEGLPGLVAEHNVIRKASWTIQNFCGEFRYNLVIDEAQHNSWRTSCSGTSIHHNVFTHLGDHGSGDSGILWFFRGESGVTFYNNTVHGGGVYTQPLIRLDNGASLLSYRNNVAAAFIGAGPLIASSVAGSVASADYNAWSVGGAQRYGTGVVVTSPGPHDTSNAAFVAAADTVYRIDEGLVWLRRFTAFDVLRYYRSVFTPAAGSGLVDSADPADGTGVDRGAVGAGAADPNDRFGSF